MILQIASFLIPCAYDQSFNADTTPVSLKTTNASPYIPPAGLIDQISVFPLSCVDRRCHVDPMTPLCFLLLLRVFLSDLTYEDHFFKLFLTRQAK